MMLKKFISQYDTRSMADAPCRAHSHWMSDFFETNAEQTQNFKYYCFDTIKKILYVVQKRVGTTVDGKYMKRNSGRRVCRKWTSFFLVQDSRT
ncbi:hypothetical protein BWQ96_06633 [Gracilariopsis chorda]|uniref:Uncharacterized protein n=1 Tax=Gracilariopsis chorda TaxID=448386 RepID=A0A2V3INH4_9FLOR|nr:hypothetical protein BWQ96_06633 [Gracilariopsis chorda]|eukprot:PXF43624.1 hypothetical protein BWQ96_06633 [Gracilariopsis chorda]